ncbi:hypothetical protein EJB05_42410, partial [Eragrostis curvula]
MEGDLGWFRGGSSSNNWDLHAVVRFACGGTGQVQGARSSSPPPSDESFSWPLPMPQPQWHDDPAVDELFQALLAAPEPEVAPHPSSPRNEEPETQQPAPADEAPAKPRRGSGGPTRSKRKSKKNQAQGSPASGLSPATTLRSPSVSVGVESYEDEEDDDTLDVRLLLEDTDMGHAEDHALLFLQPEELAPVLGSGDDVMPLPKPDEPVAGMGNDLMLVPNNKADGPERDEKGIREMRASDPCSIREHWC